MKWVEQFLSAAKTVVFEKGRLVHYLNIPSFRKSQKKIQSRPKKDRLRVGFMIQVPNSWAVLEPVYLASKEDPDVESVILLMPEVTFAYYVKITDIEWKSVYDFGEKKYGDACVRLYDPDTKQWKDPESLDLDYIFIPRPYDTYLPRPYKASSLRKIMQVCFVPYSSPLLDDYRLMYNTHFIRNLHLIFCEKQHSADYVTKKLGPTVKSGDQKVFCTGFPKFDLNKDGENLESPLWPRKRSSAIQRVIWTPRWNMDPKIGGSSFLTYKDAFLKWTGEDKSVDLVFRPHPLAREAFIRDGLITEEEWEACVNAYRDGDNTALDLTSTYYDLMWSSDVLITDVSSMLMDYMLTGHPILYCPTHAMDSTSDDPKFAIVDFLDGMYIVHDMEEIRKTLNMLREGKDPKKEKRAELARMMRRDGHIGRDIVELLKQDYASSRV